MSILKGLSLVLYNILVIVELFPMRIKNITLLVFVAWAIVTYFAFTKEIRRSFSQKRYHALVVFLLFYFLSVAMGKNLFQGVIFLLFMMRVVSPILMYDILRTCNHKTQRYFVFSLLIVFVLYAAWMYSLIERFGVEYGIKNSIMSEDSEEHVDTAFAFIYSLPILATAILLTVRSVIREGKDRKNKGRKLKIIIGLSLFAFFSLLVFKSLFMTAILILIISVSIGLFYNANGNHWIVKSGVVLLLLVVVFVTRYGGISQRVSTIGSESTDSRVSELYSLLTGGSGPTGDVNARQNLSMVSLRTFFHNPLFGANHRVGSSRYNNRVIGNHCEWFDMLALYGIFALFLYYCLYKSLKVQCRDTKELIPPLIFLLTGFLNPIFYFTVNVSLFVIVPMLKSFDTQDNLV